MIDLKEALTFTEELCTTKGTYLLSKWNEVGELEFHDSIDFTTKFDKQVEKEIYEEIRRKYPDHGFYGEELEDLRKVNREYVWHVDPVDGTKYFGRQVPLFTTVVGLTFKEKPILGAVYNPSSKQLYSGAKRLGSNLNGEKLTVTDGAKLKDSIIALELGDDDLLWEVEKIKEILEKAGRVRVFGNATMSICWSLQNALGGYIDLFGMKDHGKWQDLIAPLIMAEEAGMKVRNIHVGKKTKLVCALPSIVEQLVEILEK